MDETTSRKSRRATAEGTTVESDAPMLTTAPAVPSDPARQTPAEVDRSGRRHDTAGGRRAQTSTGDSVLPTSPDGDSPVTWGDRPTPDEDTIREVPPHWA